MTELSPAAQFAAAAAAAAASTPAPPPTTTPSPPPPPPQEQKKQPAAQPEATPEPAAAAAAAAATVVDSAVASNSSDNEDEVAPPPPAATSSSKPKQQPKKKRTVDLADEELFPSLSVSGGSASAAPGAPAWGSKSSGASPGPRSMAQDLKLSRSTEIVDLPMMKESVAETVRKIMEHTKTRVDVSHNRVLNTSTYVITGKADQVSKAKREICAKLSPMVTKVVQIPAVAKAQVVGVRGRTLQAIQSQTHTTINMPKRNVQADDVFASVDVSVVGDYAGVASAVAEIEAIVDKRTTRRVIRLADVPRDAHALLVGQQGVSLTQIQNTHPNVQIRIPGPLDMENVVALAGERADVEAAAVYISETARALLAASQVTTVPIPKRQHRFVVGDGGQTLRDLCLATGCSIQVPPPRGASENITVRGSPQALAQALPLIVGKAQSVAVEAFDPTSAAQGYGRPLLYAQRALRYLHDRNRFRRIEADFGVSLRVPSNAAAVAATSPDQLAIEITAGNPAAVAAAYHALAGLFAAFPPHHFNSIDVEPHQRVLLAGPDGSATARLQASRSVFTLFPENASDRSVLVVYEGFNPDVDRIQDAGEREKAVRGLLRRTLEEFRAIVQEDAQRASTAVVRVPAAMQKTLARSSFELESLLEAAQASDDANRAVLRFGAVPNNASTAEPANTRSTPRNAEPLEADQVEVRGPADAADRVIAELSKRVSHAEEQIRLRSFKDQVMVPQSLLARVIGRGGENIRRIQTDHDVTADSNDGVAGQACVKLQGTREGIAAAKQELDKLIERLADETSETITVAASLHRTLIGQGGRFTKRLTDKYGVHIQFPRTEGSKDSDNSLGPDEIRIRGGRTGVNAAKEEMLELAAYELEHSHTVRFTVPAACLPHIVGKAGSKIGEIKDDTQTRIDLSDASANEDGTASVEIVGTRSDVRKAREAIEAIAAEQESQIDVSLQVPARHHRFLIGAGGAHVRELITKAGGDPEAFTGRGSCHIRFPRSNAESESDQVQLKGDKAVVEKVQARIQDLVAERERMVTVRVTVPTSQHAFIIGRGGVQLKQLQEAHSVEIYFPRNRNDDVVRITGLPDNCEAAQTAILALVREEESVAVPLAAHQRLGGRGGSLWRRVRNEFDVQVDASKVDRAPESASASTRRIDTANDDDDEDFLEHVVYRDSSSNKALDGLSATWILRGEKSKLASALELVNREIKRSADATEARLRVEQRYHRHVIGKQGATIAAIRDATGCEVKVPKRGSPSQWITVEGDRNAVEQAIDMVRQAIEERD